MRVTDVTRGSPVDPWDAKELKNRGQAVFLCLWPQSAAMRIVNSIKLFIYRRLALNLSCCVGEISVDFRTKMTVRC